MKPILALFITISILLTGLVVYRRSHKDSAPRLSIRSNNSTRSNSTSSSNPFGIMPGATSGMTNETKIQIAKNLGTVYYRTSSAVFLDRWTGNCEECSAATNAGNKLVVTVRTSGGSGNPSNPPTDLAKYRKQLGEVLDATKPEILAVENEENSMALFYSGTPDQYHNQLRVACEVAHSKGIKCTNGGLVSSLVVLLTSESYRDQGDPKKADAYLNRALTEDKASQLSRAVKRQEEQITRGQALLAGYKAAGADFVNFHWYSADPQALEEAVIYLESATGLPAISNEMGQQQNESQDQIEKIMSKVKEIGLPVAVWYSIDTPSMGGARALTNPDGTLRPNGEAFQQFILRNY